MESQEAAEEKLADLVIASSHSSGSGSRTPVFVGDVDERTTEIAETDRAANGTKELMESENTDDDSFVVVNALETSADEKADDNEGDDDDDLDLDALLDDSIDGNDDAGVDNDGDKDGGPQDKNEIQTDGWEKNTPAKDDPDLDALLIDNFDGNGESDRNGEDDDEIKPDNSNEKTPSSDFVEKSVVSEDNEKLELDDILGDNGVDESPDSNDDKIVGPKEEISNVVEDTNNKVEASSKPDSSAVSEDKEALELDDILGDDGVDDMKEDIEGEITFVEEATNDKDEASSDPLSSGANEDKEALELDDILGDDGADDMKEDIEGEITFIGEDENSTDPTSNANNDTDALELDALLGDDSVDGPPRTDKIETEDTTEVVKTEDEEKTEVKDKAVNDLDSSNVNEDMDALELDALLDGSDHEVDNDDDIQVSEDKAPSRTTPKTKKQEPSLTTGGSKSVSKNSNASRSILPGLTTRTRNDTSAINTPRKIFAGRPKMTPAKKTMEGISSSVSDTLTNSKNKAIAARDRMREYSRQISTRNSNQLRKNTPLKTPAKERNLVSRSASKLSKPAWAENWSKNEFRNYMKSTVAFTNNVVESHRNRQRNMELKEDEASKIVVNITPWKTRDHVSTTNLGSGRKPRSSPSPRSKSYNAGSSLASGTVASVSRVANSVLTRRQKAEEAEREMQRRLPSLSPRGGDEGKVTPFSFIISPQKSVYKTPRKEECIVFTEEASPRFRYQTPGSKSYCGQSVGSLSSQCTVESFLSPRREGIAGCQNKYIPNLHETLGPCELCVFRLSDAEKQRLDAQGRHMMVQFTRGGCRDCSAFPKAPGEPPVRLSPKCYAQSHRLIEKRRRKRGNGSHIGYSFATVSKDTLR